jgi:hypothetical protein
MKNTHFTKKKKTIIIILGTNSLKKTYNLLLRNIKKKKKINKNFQRQQKKHCLGESTLLSCKSFNTLLMFVQMFPQSILSFMKALGVS